MNRRTFLNQSSLGALSISTLTSWSSLTPEDKENPRLVSSQASHQKEPKKILFLGDSITQAGNYINFFECQLRIAHPQMPLEVYNLGLGSETISGLSEENHPYPRPYLHNRLYKVLEYIQPDLIFACYGINCGIYHPFSEQRFHQYQSGLRELIDKAKQTNAELILLTPPPYASPIGDWETARADNNRKDYSYAQPYAAYDDVMRKYAEWIMSIEEVQTIDIQTPMREFKTLCYGNDVIHPNQLGHQLMAYVILNQYKDLNHTLKDIQWNWEISENAQFEGVSNSVVKQYATSIPKLNYIVISDHANYNEYVTKGLSFSFKILNCPSATYQCYDNNVYIGQYDQEALKNGVLINPLSNNIQYDHLSFVRKAKKVYTLISAKREIYDYALLQHIGHLRPMNRQGLPIAIAEEKKKILEEEISYLLQLNQWEVELIQLS